MNLDDFAVFILTHGRPDNVITYKTLQKCGYTGKLFFIVDNEDKTVDQYKKNYGSERVIVFDKKAVADKCDEGNNFDERRTITMARNACFDIAKEIGVTYFLQLDDDYTDFRYKFPGTVGLKMPKQIDLLFCAFIAFHKASGALSVACSQMGDFIGGIDNGVAMYRFSKRKCMNSFFCSTERTYKFIGAMNEDVNTYTTLGSRGNLFITIPVLGINQKSTQSQSGGITDMYLKYGTYCKAFTTVMMQPSSVKVSMMSSNNPRIHHSINWATTVPCILSQNHKKKTI